MWKPRTESAPATEISRSSRYHARRLRREDVLAQTLPVLERVDAREVDALVVVGVGADEAAEQEHLCDDEPGQGHELGDALHRSASYAAVKRALRRLVGAFLDTRLGRSFVAVASLERPELLLGTLGWSVSRNLTFADVNAWPSSASSFEDVAPLILSSNQANRGLAAMSLVEVAHLWRLVRDAGDATIVEIGRERGGSTFLLGAAAGGRGTIVSFDPQGKLGTAPHDDGLHSALARYGIENVELRREDSHTTEPPDGEYALVLVDGDPSYEGTKLDFERFCRRLRPGGHALFHDAAANGPRRRQLAPLMSEIERDSAFDRQADVGTFAHFIRTIDT